MSPMLDDALDQLEHWEEHFQSRLSPPPLGRSAFHSAEDRLADRITNFAGSMKFVYVHLIWFGAWIVLNVGLLALIGIRGWQSFDAYPFGLLTMLVSLEAIFLSTFVMIAQNRMSAVADARAQADYEADLKAE